MGLKKEISSFNKEGLVIAIRPSQMYLRFINWCSLFLKEIFKVKDVFNYYLFAFDE